MAAKKKAAKKPSRTARVKKALWKENDAMAKRRAKKSGAYQTHPGGLVMNSKEDGELGSALSKAINKVSKHLPSAHRPKTAAQLKKFVAAQKKAKESKKKAAAKKKKK